MQRIQPDLWVTDTEHPAPGLKTQAYLLTRPDGNVLFYSTGLRHELDAIAGLGGVAHQFLSHRDEAGDALREIGERFGAELHAHAAEAADLAPYRAATLPFARAETRLGNVAVMPTPGHSPGSTCFAVESPHGGRYLFTGDTLYRGADGAWHAGLIPGVHTAHDRWPLAVSLSVLRGLAAPDLVCGSAFAGDAAWQRIERRDWRGCVDAAIDRLLRAPADAAA